MNCRHCHAALTHTFVDLGKAPPSNAYLVEDALDAPEKQYPLEVLYCDKCWLVQTRDFADREELFTEDYAYFSSASDSWLEHAARYARDMTARLGLDSRSRVVEVASNDGYLLRNFVAAGIPSLGIEPTAACAKAARDLGIETREEFFGVELAERLAKEGFSADLMAANNVLAHVPDINDFLSGFARLLKPKGVATFEFPHLCNLVRDAQFDTIYHEHYSYLSLTVVARMAAANGLQVFDVERIPTHGGSLRVFAQRTDTGTNPESAGLTQLLDEERQVGVETRAYYEGFQPRADALRDAFRAFVRDRRAQGHSVAGYGAAAKGNTMLNFARMGADDIDFIVDRSPIKVGRFTPGGHIPIVSEDVLKRERPAYVVIFPWNLTDEISSQLDYIRDWGGKFVVYLPELRVF